VSMWLTWALLGVVGVSGQDVYAAIAAGACANAVGCQGFYRGFSFTTSPAGATFLPVSGVTGISVGALGAQATTTGTGAAIQVDAAGIRFKTPADTSDATPSMSFYFGYLGLGGTWNAGTSTTAVVGAAAEVLASISDLFVYYDNDGVSGFQWDITQTDVTKRYDIFNVATGKTSGYDAVDPKGIIALPNLTWTNIVHSVVNCSVVLPAGNYHPHCEIHSLFTNGSLTGVAVPVIQFTIRIASQPVLINGVRHGPDLAKFDVVVNYPYSSFSLSSPSTAKLAFVNYAAGKSANFVATAVSNAGQDSFTFASTDGKAHASYQYQANVDVDGASQPVTTQVITGAEVLAFSCALTSPCFLTTTQAYHINLFATATWLQGLGWKPSLAVHSLGTGAMPTKVMWDPQVGAGPSGTASSAMVAVPSVLFLLAIMLVQ